MRATKASPSDGLGFSRNSLVIPALVAFIAVDIVLVALSLGWGRDQPQAAAWPSPTRTGAHAADEDDSEGDVVARSSRSDPESVSPESAPRLLSASSETVAWRTEGGACDRRESLELTIDGGETWGDAYPTVDGLGRPLWISGADYTAVQSAVAFGADCEPRGVRTFDSGASWVEDDQAVANSVLVDPTDPSELIWAGETIPGPCLDMIQVAVTGGVVSAVCGDGSIWSAPPDGGDWARTGVERAVAVNGSDGHWIAAVESSECDGLALVGFESTSVEPLACTDARAAGSTAVDVAGNTLWLWAGDQVLVSDDLGRSFNG